MICLLKLYQQDLEREKTLQINTTINKEIKEKAKAICPQYLDSLTKEPIHHLQIKQRGTKRAISS